MTNWERIVNKYGKVKMLCAIIKTEYLGDCHKCLARTACFAANEFDANEVLEKWMDDDSIGGK